MTDEHFDFINIEKNTIVSTNIKKNNNINESKKINNFDDNDIEKDFEINFIQEVNIILIQTINGFIDCFKNLKNKINID